MNLAEKYAELVARRPEMAVVDDDGCSLAHDGTGWHWQIDSKPLGGEGADAAEALILAKLLRELPKYHAIASDDVGHFIMHFDSGEYSSVSPTHFPDPLSALFAFYLSTPSAKEEE